MTKLAVGLVDKMALQPLTGAGVRVAIVDSGVHPGHPHVGTVAGRVAFDERGQRGGDTTDRLGHGTAVAAAIREKAPGAEILVARVFDRRLETTVASLVGALRWARDERADLVNLSLGTVTADHAAPLQAAVDEVRAVGGWVVAAGADAGVLWLPGTLDRVVSVTLDWSLDRHQAFIDRVTPTTIGVRASGWPRPIPGLPRERNLKGLSFAVANATGLLALLAQAQREWDTAGNQRANMS